MSIERYGYMDRHSLAKSPALAGAPRKELARIGQRKRVTRPRDHHGNVESR